MHKIMWLAAQNSIHTVRWVNALANREHEIHLLTMSYGNEALDERVQCYRLPFSAPHGYYLNALSVRRLIQRIRPDFIHAHYASGYGTLARICGLTPYILSVWGSDVFDFPMESALKRRILIKNLRAATLLCSTSHVMAEHTQTLAPCVNLPIVTPFGIDIKQFGPNIDYKDDNYLTIGTIKTLAPKYGIDVLIKAFALVRNKLQQADPSIASRLRLVIVGGGDDRAALEDLARSLGVNDSTQFTGAIAHDDVPEYLNLMDIYVAASRLDSESFGVAVLEASACGVPVVVSDAGGLPEVVVDGETGIVVRRENIEETARAIEQLVVSPELRTRLGQNGRRHVAQHYSWEASVDRMEQVYQELLELKTSVSM